MLRQLNFLEKSTRPEIAHAVQQCARLAANTQSSHKQAMFRIGRYLIKTRERGMMMKPKNAVVQFRI